MAVDTSTPAIVLKCLCYPWHSGTIGVVRSLGRLGVDVYLSGENRCSPAVRSRYLAGVLHDTPTSDPEELLDRLHRVSLGQPPALIPVDDVGTLFLDQYGDQLTERFLFPRQPPGLSGRLADKGQLAVLAAGSDVPCPETVPVYDVADAARVARRLGFPVVVKASDPAVLAEQTGGRSVRVARDPAELEAAVRPLLDPPNAVLQEYLCGDSSAVWMVNAYLDHRSVSLFAGVGRKLRQLPVDTGASTLAVVEPNREILTGALGLLATLGYRGIVDLGVRADPRRGGFRLLDVNPRIGATFRLFVGEDGMDVARAFYLDLTGQPVPRSSIRAGRRWLAEHRDVVAATQLIRAGRLTRRQYLKSMLPVHETTWLDVRDVRPGLAFGGAAVKAAVRARRRPDGVPRTADRDDPARAVDEYFNQHAHTWDAMYRTATLSASIYQERARRCLAWVDDLTVPAPARLLEVGSGAGRTAAELAGRGFAVNAVDVAEQMLTLARRRADDRHPGAVPTYLRADVLSLPFADASHAVVVALGVIPWLSEPRPALAEMARVLVPGGFLVVSADNRMRLTHILDPRYTPALAGLRGRLKRIRPIGAAVENAGPRATMHSPREFDELLARAGLVVVRAAGIGFGPFTTLGLGLLPEPAARRIHDRLQAMADAGRGALSMVGAQYLVLARKPATHPT